jgi:hypothetical protein
VIIDKAKNIIFRTPLTDDDTGVVHTMAENSYFSRCTILRKVYSFFGIDGSSIIMGRRSKKVLLRSKVLDLNFMSFTNVINIQGFKILFEIESIISDADRLAMFPETGQYMGHEEYIVGTEEELEDEEVDLNDGADDFSEDEDYYGAGQQTINLANLLR